MNWRKKRILLLRSRTEEQSWSRRLLCLAYPQHLVSFDVVKRL